MLRSLHLCWSPRSSARACCRNGHSLAVAAYFLFVYVVSLCRSHSLVRLFLSLFSSTVGLATPLFSSTNSSYVVLPPQFVCSTVFAHSFGTHCSLLPPVFILPSLSVSDSPSFLTSCSSVPDLLLVRYPHDPRVALPRFSGCCFRVSNPWSCCRGALVRSPERFLSLPCW